MFKGRVKKKKKSKEKNKKTLNACKKPQITC